MKEEFVTFQKFNDPALAQAAAELLTRHRIEFETEKSADYFDPTLVRREADQEVAIKLRGTDFEKANRLLEAEAEQQINETDKNYYLYNFSESELMEVIAKPDEWNQYDYVLAQKILKTRGKEVSAEQLQALKKQRDAELHKPEESQSLWVFLGYLFALGGGLLGMFIGWHLNSFKKTLPNGERIYAYSPEDRRHGKIIFIIGVAAFVLSLIFGSILALTGALSGIFYYG